LILIRDTPQALLLGLCMQSPDKGGEKLDRKEGVKRGVGRGREGNS